MGGPALASSHVSQTGLFKVSSKLQYYDIENQQQSVAQSR